jgi:hypothetical protein
MSPVFSGTVVAAYTQFDQAPDVACRFDCNSGLGASTAPAAATSYAGSTDVATIMSSFAKQMNVGFENNGVNVKLSAPYFWGNVREQVRDAAEAANVNAEVIEGKLCIWPKGGNRNTTTVPEIGAATGMIGYPAYTQNGMIVKTIFSPKISFGGLVHVTSTLFSAAAQSKSANASQVLPQDGNWAIYKIDHALDAFMPGGQWMSTVYGYNPKYPRPTVPGPVLS